MIGTRELPRRGTGAPVGWVTTTRPLRRVGVWVYAAGRYWYWCWR